MRTYANGERDQSGRSDVERPLHVGKRRKHITENVMKSSVSLRRAHWLVLEDVLHDVPAGAGWLDHVADSFHFTLVQNIKRDPFEESVGVDQIGDELGRYDGRTADRIPIRLEHAADWPTAVDGAPDDVREVSAAAKPGELQPQRDPR
jgi:hypothetical protein